MKANPKDALRLTAAVLLFAATTAVAVAVVSRRLESARRVGAGEANEVVIAPSAASEGVTFLPGAGRLLIVDSSPANARVVVGGTAVGATPWSSDWKCETGALVELRIEHAGFKPFSTSARCLDGTTRVTATLARAK